MQALYAHATSAAPPAVKIDAVLVDVSCQQQAHATLNTWRRAYPHAAIVLASGRFSAGDKANDAMAARLGVTPRLLAKPFYAAPTYGQLWAFQPQRTAQATRARR